MTVGFMEANSTAGLHAKPLKGLSDTWWNCQGSSMEEVPSGLGAVDERLEK